MATHSSILAWRIPWTEEPGEIQSMGSQRVWTTEHTRQFMPGWTQDRRLLSLTGVRDVRALEKRPHTLRSPPLRTSSHSAGVCRLLLWALYWSGHQTWQRFQRKFWTQENGCGNPLILLQRKVAIPRSCSQGPVPWGNGSQLFLHTHDNPGACPGAPWLGKNLGAGPHWRSWSSRTPRPAIRLLFTLPAGCEQWFTMSQWGPWHYQSRQDRTPPLSAQ